MTRPMSGATAGMDAHGERQRSLFRVVGILRPFWAAL